MNWLSPHGRAERGLSENVQCKNGRNRNGWRPHLTLLKSKIPLDSFKLTSRLLIGGTRQFVFVKSVFLKHTNVYVPGTYWSLLQGLASTNSNDIEPFCYLSPMSLAGKLEPDEVGGGCHRHPGVWEDGGAAQIVIDTTPVHELDT